MATDDLTLGVIEETDNLVTVKRENIIADGVYEERNDVWLLTATNRTEGAEYASGKVDTKYEALV